jgi:hypothetical protein
MMEEQEEMYDYLMELSTEDAVNALLNWHGLQLLSKKFGEETLSEYGFNPSWVEEEDD